MVWRGTLEQLSNMHLDHEKEINTTMVLLSGFWLFPFSHNTNPIKLNSFFLKVTYLRFQTCEPELLNKIMCIKSIII